MRIASGREAERNRTHVLVAGSKRITGRARTGEQENRRTGEQENRRTGEQGKCYMPYSSFESPWLT
jgi:hypothetical protein